MPSSERELVEDRMDNGRKISLEQQAEFTVSLAGSPVTGRGIDVPLKRAPLG